MKSVTYLLTRLRGLLRRDAVLDDIDREMRAHIDLVARENVERGMPPDEARAAAERSFGNVAGYRDLAHDVPAPRAADPAHTPSEVLDALHARGLVQ